MPSYSTWLAEFVGIGRGVDLILYTWVGISLIVILNLHLKLRTQLELITILARKIALAEPAAPSTRVQDHSLVPPVAMAQDVSAAPRSRDGQARAVTAGRRSLRTGDQTA